MWKKIDSVSTQIENKDVELLENIDLDKKNIKKLQLELERLYDDIRIKFEKEEDLEKKNILLTESEKILKRLVELKKSIKIKNKNTEKNEIPRSLANRDSQVRENILNASGNLKKVVENAEKDKNFIASLAGKGLKRLQS